MFRRVAPANCISEPEGEMELLHPSVQLVLLCILLDRPEVCQNSDKVLEVHLLLLLTSALEEEGVDNPVTEGVDC